MDKEGEEGHDYHSWILGPLGCIFRYQVLDFVGGMNFPAINNAHMRNETNTDPNTQPPPSSSPSPASDLGHYSNKALTRRYQENAKQYDDEHSAGGYVS
jgi:hypothetical protein